VGALPKHPPSVREIVGEGQHAGRGDLRGPHGDALLRKNREQCRVGGELRGDRYDKPGACGVNPSRGRENMRIGEREARGGAGDEAARACRHGPLPRAQQRVHQRIVRGDGDESGNDVQRKAMQPVRDAAA